MTYECLTAASTKDCEQSQPSNLRPYAAEQSDTGAGADFDVPTGTEVLLRAHVPHSCVSASPEVRTASSLCVLRSSEFAAEGGRTVSVDCCDGASEEEKQAVQDIVQRLRSQLGGQYFRVPTTGDTAEDSDPEYRICSESPENTTTLRCNGGRWEIIILEKHAVHREAPAGDNVKPDDEWISEQLEREPSIVTLLEQNSNQSREARDTVWTYYGEDGEEVEVRVMIDINHPADFRPLEIGKFAVVRNARGST